MTDADDPLAKYSEDDLDEDWIKVQRWDVYAGDKLLDTLDELIDLMQMADQPVVEQKRAVRAFTGLPAWEAAPDSLKQQVVEFLG